MTHALCHSQFCGKNIPDMCKKLPYLNIASQLKCYLSSANELTTSSSEIWDVNIVLFCKMDKLALRYWYLHMIVLLMVLSDTNSNLDNQQKVMAALDATRKIY